MKNNYELVASGEKWIKSDVKSTFRAISEIIDKTQSSLILTIYIITNKDILEKVKYCETFNECANTNIQKVFELILNTAKKNKIPQKELPSSELGGVQQPGSAGADVPGTQ